MAGKLPWFKCFADDLDRLRLCSLAARGLWIELLSLMHKCDRRGYLQQANGKPMTAEQTAIIAGCSPDGAAHLLRELVDSGALAVSEDGLVYSRTMVRDEHRRQAGRENGRMGGNPALKGKKVMIGLTQSPTQSQPNGQPNHQPKPSVCVIDPINHSPKREEGGVGGGGGGEAERRWLLFWDAFPRKENKANARKAFARLAPDEALLAEMLAALARQKQSSQWLRGVIPHGATWINGRRWEDEAAPEAAGSLFAGAFEDN